MESNDLNPSLNREINFFDISCIVLELLLEFTLGSVNICGALLALE